MGSRTVETTSEGPAAQRFVLSPHRADVARGLVLAAAFISFILSVSLWFTGSEMEGIFVGVWVPSILALGAFLLPRSTG
mgnify:CR=1 FL=1